MKRLLLPIIVQFMICLSTLADEASRTTTFSGRSRNLTVSDGLPNNEVRRLIELPNGQMLVNCEGTFCLFNGRRFVDVACEGRGVCFLPHFSDGYAHGWQGDSLLWLQDFYRIYLFDAQTRRFLRIPSTLEEAIADSMTAESAGACLMADSAHVAYGIVTATCTDGQGGVWIGGRDNGILYMGP